LNKAKKEIEECEKLGKRKKHRGLLEIESDIETAKKHIEKATHNLELIDILEKKGYTDWSVNAAFYVIYHCFLGIAIKFGYESRNQTCTVSLIEYLKEEGKIAIDDKYIDMLKYAEVDEGKGNSVIEMREELTYGIKISAQDKDKIKELCKDCKALIDVAKEIIYG
jgi:uncharacterized protein (UPF0332 family)